MKELFQICIFFYLLKIQTLFCQQFYQDVLNIETKLAEMSEDNAFFRSPKNIDHVTGIQQIKQRYPNIDFKTYFDKIDFLSSSLKFI